MAGQSQTQFVEDRKGAGKEHGSGWKEFPCK